MEKPDAANVYNIQAQHYSEYDSLKLLCINLDEALKRDWKLEYDSISIIVNGQCHQFYLGGPQVDALFSFIKDICGENLYDFDEMMEALDGEDTANTTPVSNATLDSYWTTMNETYLPTDNNDQ